MHGVPMTVDDQSMNISRPTRINSGIAELCCPGCYDPMLWFRRQAVGFETCKPHWLPRSSTPSRNH